jgi:valyl-tRNA synthetase
MTTEIEIPHYRETQIIPKLEFESPLDLAVGENEQLVTRLEPLRQRALQLEVKNKEDYEAIGRILSEVRSIRKNEVVPLWSKFNAVVAKVREFLQGEQRRAENRCEEIDGICRSKMKAYEIAEAKATAKEQKKHPEGQVEADIPAVAGYRRSTTYPVAVEDPKALLRELLRCYKKGDKTRVAFLSQFVMLDVKALEKYARETKDVKKFNSEIPGAFCTKEGA